MRVADYAGRIKQEHRACIDTHIIVENAVGLTHGAVRPVIGQQRKRQTAQLLCPGLQTGNSVGADLQNFDIERLEVRVVLTEPQDLILSAAGKRERQK